MGRVVLVASLALTGALSSVLGRAAEPGSDHAIALQRAQGAVRPVGALHAAPMKLGPVVSKTVQSARITVPKGYAVATSGPTVARHSVNAPAAQDLLAPVNQATSINWAGMYTTQTYTGASGSWKQPEIATLKSNHFGSTWVGVDGFSNSDLIQTGSEADNFEGHRVYRAWWEILPDAETVIYLNGKPAPVSANDRFIGQVVQVSPGTWSISLQDETRKWAFQTTQAYSGPGTSAEFIEEASAYGSIITTPPHFQPVTFSSLEVQKAGQWHYTDFTTYNEIKLRQHDHTYAYPSGPNTRFPQYFQVYYKLP